ncbi:MULTISPECIES: outer membrane lipoprotein LolB [Massilia]|uniref:Outer-membrane lipoprotein LolB n=1 Tax=Massilia haematophila TaxID=457923 RepID=A0ABV7PN56_9BURK|nr:outer membrane lipoprotein LolB [Massilia sp.]HBZ05797.1 outer membrane lipoprotein LolB [Massilia sp.]
MPITRRLTLFAFAAALAGCASAPLSQSTVADYRETIDLSGRLSVNYEKDGQPGSVTGNFEWSQQPGRIDVSLASPLGQTLAEISVTPQGATLTQAGREPLSAQDIDTLTSQALGWSLPVAGLRDWMQGYATAADGTRFVASPANNNVFTKDGWRLRFVSWQDEKAARPVPQRIDAERSATATSGELQIRIIINPAA